MRQHAVSGHEPAVTGGAVAALFVSILAIQWQKTFFPLPARFRAKVRLTHVLELLIFESHGMDEELLTYQHDDNGHAKWPHLAINRGKGNPLVTLSCRPMFLNKKIRALPGGG